jgi:hypothetical protein
MPGRVFSSARVAPNVFPKTPQRINAIDVLLCIYPLLAISVGLAFVDRSESPCKSELSERLRENETKRWDGKGRAFPYDPMGARS